MTPLGLYIHWPYCTKVCPYCDFNVVRARHVDIDRWREVLLEDLSYWAEQSPGYLHSIYFGGGTPSLMPPSLVAHIIEAAKKLWRLKEPLEITLEANPTDAEKDRFGGFRDAGVNRLSLGVQSFDDKALQFLGRNHDAAEARRGIQTAQAIFARTNFDLIYGLPNQTRREWCDQLTTAIDFGAGHLSIYQLTIEQGTAFAKAVARGAWQPIAQVQEAALYDIAQEICDRHGLRAYEVSNHAKPGEESVHNLIYWHYHDYIGIGPGGHGRVQKAHGRYATQGEHRIKTYLEAATPEQRYTQERLTPPDLGIEYLSMGLRLESGISHARFQALSGTGLPYATLKKLYADGLLISDCDNLRTTAKGRLVLNAVLLELTAHLD